MKRWRVEIGLAAAALGSSLLVYWPFRKDMSAVYRFWDAPSYLAISRTLYATGPGNPLWDGVHPPIYVAHLPLYPLLVRAFSFVGAERALLVVSVGSAALAAVVFYRLCRDVWKFEFPGWLALAFLLLPPRWFLYRSTGASESLYMLLVLLSVLWMEKGFAGRSCAAAGLAASTRVFGILLLPAWFLVMLQKRFSRRMFLWLALIPAGFGAYLVFCDFRFGSFFAPFEPNLDKASSLLPFASLPWILRSRLVAHAELHILLAFVYAVGIARIRRFPVIFWYSLTQFVFLIFVNSEDWSRYFLSMAPFALIVGFRDLLASRAVRWFLLPATVALSLIYAWGAIPANQLPPAVYQRLLVHLGLA